MLIYLKQMNIKNLFNLDKVYSTKDYKQITFQEDLEKDSYIQVIKKQITLLNQIRDDYGSILFCLVGD